MSARIAVVTASIDLERAEPAIWSWIKTLRQPIDLYLVVQGTDQRGWEVVKRGGLATLYGYHHREILGVVPAFAIGVQRALNDGAPIIACFHDDLEIEQQDWDEDVWRLFKACPRAGLCGFGGGKGLGDSDIYRKPYSPMQLARQQFISNMRDAEAHGERSLAAQPVACLDGFSQIGLWDFWRGVNRETPVRHHRSASTNLFRILELVGMVHHAYDAALGCFAKLLNYQVWYIPVACHHHGGLTAVADPRYQQWADDFTWHNAVTGEEVRGDAGYWQHAHSIVYHMFQGVLPIRT